MGDYSYEYNVLCECSDNLGQPVKVTVTDGVIESVVYAESGEMGKAGDPPVISGSPRYHIINGLFRVIQNAIDDEADQITVSYDSELGYPKNIEIDYDVNATRRRVYPHCHSLLASLADSSQPGGHCSVFGEFALASTQNGSLTVDQGRHYDDYGRARRGASGALNPQSAIAGLKPSPEVQPPASIFGKNVESRALRGGNPRTPSGPEGSSGKRALSSAAGQPGLSLNGSTLRGHDRRVVHGLY